MSTAFLYRRTCMQRLQAGAFATPASGSLRTSPRTLRPVLSSEDGNFSGKQTGLPVVFRTLLWQSARHQKHVERRDSPRMRGDVAEACRWWTPCDLKLCKLGVLAKIAAPLTRAHAHFFPKALNGPCAKEAASPPHFFFSTGPPFLMRPDFSQPIGARAMAFAPRRHIFKWITQ